MSRFNFIEMAKLNLDQREKSMKSDKQWNAERLQIQADLEAAKCLDPEANILMVSF